VSIPPKGMVADHWTWRDGKAFVTGWHWPTKRGKQQEELVETPVTRGLVATSMAKPKRAKPEQGQLL
jgi:hypothetical protein